jgi:hypothetical protein
MLKEILDSLAAQALAKFGARNSFRRGHSLDEDEAVRRLDGHIEGAAAISSK